VGVLAEILGRYLRDQEHVLNLSFGLADAERLEGLMGLPQAYRALPESSRREVRETVKARLARFESIGRLIMSVEMLIASGRA
jgi:hypothetical protein